MQNRGDLSTKPAEPKFQRRNQNSEGCQNPDCIKFTKTLVDRYDYIEKENEQLKEQLKKYQDYDQILHDKNQAQLNLKQQQEEIQQLKRDLERAQNENQRLNKNMDNLANENEQIKNQNQQRQTVLQNDKQQTEQELQQLIKENNMLQQQINEQRQEIDQLYGEQNKKERELRQMRKQFEEEGDKAPVIERENQKLRQKLAEQSQQLQEQQHEIQQMRSQPQIIMNQSHQSSMQGGDREYVKHAGRGRHPAQSQIPEQQNLNKIENLELKIQQLQQEKVQMKQQIDGVNNNRQDRINDMGMNIEQLNKDILVKEQTIQNMDKRFTKDRMEMESKINELEEEIISLKQQLKIRSSKIQGQNQREVTYQQQINQLQQLRDKDVGDLRERIRKLERQIMNQEAVLGNVENENNQLKLELRDYKSGRNHRQRELTEEVQSLKKECDYLKDMVAQRTREAQNHETCQNKISQLLSDNQQLQHVIADKNNQISDLKEQQIQLENQKLIDYDEQRQKIETQMTIAFDNKYLEMQNRLEDTIQHLEQDLNKEQIIQQKLRRDLQDYKDEVTRLKEEIDTVRNHYQSVQLEHQTLTRQTYQKDKQLELQNNLEDENLKLKLQVKDLEFINSDLRNKFETRSQFFEQKSKELEKKCQEQQDEIHNLKHDLNHQQLDSKQQISKLQQSNYKQAMQANTQVESQIEYYKKELSQLQLQKDRIERENESKIEELTTDLNILSNDIQDKEATIDYLKSEIQDLKDQRSAMQNHIKERVTAPAQSQIVSTIKAPAKTVHEYIPLSKQTEEQKERNRKTVTETISNVPDQTVQKQETVKHHARSYQPVQYQNNNNIKDNQYLQQHDHYITSNINDYKNYTYRTPDNEQVTNKYIQQSDRYDKERDGQHSHIVQQSYSPLPATHSQIHNPQFSYSTYEKQQQNKYIPQK